MGPLWCGQGTVPHTTLSDLLSTDVLVSPTGAPVGAGEESFTYTQLGIAMYIMSVVHTC